jgi:hypothetical protein
MCCSQRHYLRSQTRPDNLPAAFFSCKTFRFIPSPNKNKQQNLQKYKKIFFLKNRQEAKKDAACRRDDGGTHRIHSGRRRPLRPKRIAARHVIHSKNCLRMSADRPGSVAAEGHHDVASVYERQVRDYLDSSRLRPILQDAVTSLLSLPELPTNPYPYIAHRLHSALRAVAVAVPVLPLDLPRANKDDIQGGPIIFAFKPNALVPSIQLCGLKPFINFIWPPSLTAVCKGLLDLLVSEKRDESGARLQSHKSVCFPTLMTLADAKLPSGIVPFPGCAGIADHVMVDGCSLEAASSIFVAHILRLANRLSSSGHIVKGIRIPQCAKLEWTLQDAITAMSLFQQDVLCCLLTPHSVCMHVMYAIQAPQPCVVDVTVSFSLYICSPQLKLWRAYSCAPFDCFYNGIFVNLEGAECLMTACGDALAGASQRSVSSIKHNDKIVCDRVSAACKLHISELLAQGDLHLAAIHAVQYMAIVAPDGPRSKRVTDIICGDSASLFAHILTLKSVAATFALRLNGFEGPSCTALTKVAQTQLERCLKDLPAAISSANFGCDAVDCRAVVDRVLLPLVDILSSGDRFYRHAAHVLPRAIQLLRGCHVRSVAQMWHDPAVLGNSLDKWLELLIGVRMPQGTVSDAYDAALRAQDMLGHAVVDIVEESNAAARDRLAPALFSRETVALQYCSDTGLDVAISRIIQRLTIESLGPFPLAQALAYLKSEAILFDVVKFVPEEAYRVIKAQRLVACRGVVGLCQYDETGVFGSRCSLESCPISDFTCLRRIYNALAHKYPNRHGEFEIESALAVVSASTVPWSPSDDAERCAVRCHLKQRVVLNGPEVCMDAAVEYIVNSIIRALLKLHDTTPHVVAGLYLAKDNGLLGTSCRLDSHNCDFADSHWPPARMRREHAALMADINSCLEARLALYAIIFVNQSAGSSAPQPLCCVRQEFEISFIASDSVSFKRICLYTPSPLEAFSFTFLTVDDAEAWMRSIDASGAVARPSCTSHSFCCRRPLRPCITMGLLCAAHDVTACFSCR